MNNELIRKIAIAAMPTIDVEKWLDSIIEVSVEWGIKDERLCMFLAHLGHESNDLNSLVENLNYSVEALLKLFSRSRISHEDCHRYGRKAGQSANQQALANILYGGEWGFKHLGNDKYNDGWNFRGRGAIQLTGRFNYRKCGKALGVDLLNEPHHLSRDKLTTLRAAAWFYNTRTRGTDIVQVTRQINGGSNGLEDRRQRFERALQAFTSFA